MSARKSPTFTEPGGRMRLTMDREYEIQQLV